MRRSIVLGVAAMLSVGVAGSALAQDKLAPKVMVITMFGEEAKPWLEGEQFTSKVAVPGLFKEYPNVDCNEAGLCHMTTGMGFANAASSVAAVVLSDQFDLRDTYVVIAGIAGVDPEDGTLGSAHWARFAVDGGLYHAIDPRQVPEGWAHGVVPLGAAEPGQAAKWSAGTEVYRLSEPLLQQAFALSRQVELMDGDQAKAYRQAYAPPPELSAPLVSICDTLSSDTYWHGSMIADAMASFVASATKGEGNYCTTQMEDNATLTALRRGADAGLLDFDRIAVLRTASNFDREPPGKTAIESLTATSGGFVPSTTNAYRVASKLTDAILADWDNWKDGVPPMPAP
ncbi:MAG TPA: purine nucleoside permease [Geminicoccus sp.]|uniref:purine-nucleoside phosphorylase n=1 Tax=Geminicoccus sp. TaxID=2024832 RepID=UPI002E377BB9|nr:purine nucleoside permease [Geminicoccus sp.]HEX2529461.1 purine nucleoside permease [Geminicoccus sp.]